METIILAEDNDLHRQELRSAMDTEHGLYVIGEARDGWEAWEKVEHLAPDILVVNSSIPGLNCRAIAERTLEQQPQVRLVIVRWHDGTSYVCESIKGGVIGFEMDTADTGELIRNLRDVLQGKFVPRFTYFWDYSA